MVVLFIPWIDQHLGAAVERAIRDRDLRPAGRDDPPERRLEIARCGLQEEPTRERRDNQGHAEKLPESTEPEPWNLNPATGTR